MTGIVEEPIQFKDFKTACDYAEKNIFKGQPRYIVESFVHFQIHHKSIMDKIISGEKLTDEEEEIYNQGTKYKKTRYEHNGTIENSGEIICEEDAPQELIDKHFTDDVKEDDVERVELEDVPENSNQEKIKEIMDAEFDKEQEEN